MKVFVNDKPIDIHCRARLRDVFLKYCTLYQLTYDEQATAHDQWGNEVMHSGQASKDGKYYINL